jgi:hypothetical protein
MDVIRALLVHRCILFVLKNSSQRLQKICGLCLRDMQMKIYRGRTRVARDFASTLLKLLLLAAAAAAAAACAVHIKYANSNDDMTLKGLATEIIPANVTTGNFA